MLFFFYEKKSFISPAFPLNSRYNLFEHIHLEVFEIIYKLQTNSSYNRNKNYKHMVTNTMTSTHLAHSASRPDIENVLGYFIAKKDFCLTNFVITSTVLQF